MVKSPGVADGSVGFQFFTFHRNEFWSPWMRPTNTSDDDGRADRAEPRPVMADLGFLEDVVPERRRRMQALLLGDGAVGRAVAVGGDLVRRQRVLDLHVLGHVLAGRQAELDAALAGCGTARLPPPPGRLCSAVTRYGSSLRDGVVLTGAPPLAPSSWKRRQSMIQLLTAASAKPPARREVADDVAREPGEGEEQAEVLRVVEYPVVANSAGAPSVAEAVGRRRELDRHVGHFLEPIELAAVVQDLRDDALPASRSTQSCSTIH